MNSKLASKQILSCFKMQFKEGVTSLGLQDLNIKEEMVKGEYLEEELLLVKEEGEELMEIKEEVVMEQKEIKWGTMIPLVGGSALGCERAAGSLPQYHLTYSPFANNEAHLRSHWAREQV